MFPFALWNVTKIRTSLYVEQEEGGEDEEKESLGKDGGWRMERRSKKGKGWKVTGCLAEEDQVDT